VCAAAEINKSHKIKIYKFSNELMKMEEKKEGIIRILFVLLMREGRKNFANLFIGK
jgi:hypothetical protein